MKGESRSEMGLEEDDSQVEGGREMRGPLVDISVCVVV
jgi:hypothetical protein